ncbi:MAG: DUF6242 domain-containing protein [Pseudoflavonifractor sp.]|nr:DUF6242 domain-containing protein [Alloprevotella sp.]MCM1116462.1 DUF6242 domain-containing protein [Pseudoflavonifractor sp.]
MKLCLPICIMLAALSLGLLPSCSADNEDEEWNVLTYSNVSVKNFSLVKNDSVLANLDTVFFSIDLNRGRIFNADSLPKGTPTNALAVSISLPEVSRAMIYFNGEKGRDSIDYMTSSTDTINFANGPATLSITSADGLASRDYLISVNVHKQNPDSLAWGNTALRTLPTSLNAPSRCRAIELDGTYYCLTANASGSEADIASTANIQEDWTMEKITLPAKADVASFSGANGKMFILNAQGHLFSSSDKGKSWTDTGTEMTYIYGAYGTELLGNLRRADGTYVTISYPSASDPATATPLPDRCPVKGTSTLLVYTTEWAAKPMAIFTGGSDAQNRLSGSSWAYDGNQWADISITPGLPRQGMTIIPYIGYRTGQFWIVKDYRVLMAFGGKSERGVNDNSLWISFDRGIHWAPGSASLQLPAYMPALSGVSTFVQDQTLSTNARSSASQWKGYPEAPLPSRASIDLSWQCPYIYMVGGYTDASRLSLTIWRGAINRLTYQPLF